MGDGGHHLCLTTTKSYSAFIYLLQSTLVISTSVISNNRLSRRENLVLVLTQKSKIRLQNIVEKRRNCSWGAIFPLFHNIFNVYFLLKESNYIVICKILLFKYFFFNTTNLICRSTDISKCFEGPFDFEITRVDCIIYLFILLNLDGGNDKNSVFLLNMIYVTRN